MLILNKIDRINRSKHIKIQNTQNINKINITTINMENKISIIISETIRITRKGIKKKDITIKNKKNIVNIEKSNLSSQIMIFY